MKKPERPTTTIMLSREAHAKLIALQRHILSQSPPGVSYTLGDVVELLVCEHGESLLSDLPIQNASRSG